MTRERRISAPGGTLYPHLQKHRPEAATGKLLIDKALRRARRRAQEAAE